MPASDHPRRLSRRSLLRAGGLVALTAACRGPFGAPRADTAATEPPGRVAYTGGRIYRDGAFTDGTVIVENGRIVDVADDSSGNAQPYDAAGLWLIPGFVDAHVHLQFSSAAAILGGGVTTVRDLGSPRGLATRIGATSPLRVLGVGRILTAVAGYPSQSWGADGTSRQISDPDDAIAAVAEQVADGAGAIKVALEPAAGPVISPEVLDAIVSAAHAEGLIVTAHVGDAEHLALAIAHGVDELAHLPLHDVTPAQMTDAARAGMTLVPTLEIRGRDRGALRAVEAFLNAGGTVVYGTDLGNNGTAPGIERPELRAMLDAGMSPSAVLNAATVDAAGYLGLTDVGRIAPNAVADLVGLRRDPLTDVAAYDAIALVVAGGARVIG